MAPKRKAKSNAAASASPPRAVPPPAAAAAPAPVAEDEPVAAPAAAVEAAAAADAYSKPATNGHSDSGAGSGGGVSPVALVAVAVLAAAAAYVFQSGGLSSSASVGTRYAGSAGVGGAAPHALHLKPGSRLSTYQSEHVPNGVHPKHHLRTPHHHHAPQQRRHHHLLGGSATGAAAVAAPPQWALQEVFAGWLTAYGTGDCYTYVSYFSADAVLQDPYGNNITGYQNLLNECLTSAAYWTAMSFTWDTQYINNFGLAARTFISLQRPASASPSGTPCTFIWEEPYLINVVYNATSPWAAGLSINYALGVSNSPLLGALCNTTQPPNCLPASAAGRASKIVRNPKNANDNSNKAPGANPRLNSCSYGSADLQSWQSDVQGYDVDALIALYENWITAFGRGDCATYANYYTPDACMNDPYGTLTCGGGNGGNLYNRCLLSHSTWTAFSYSWDFMYVNANGLAVETQVALQKPNPTPGYAPCLFILKEMIILNVTSNYQINNIIGLYNETWLDEQCPGTPPFTNPYVTPQPYEVNVQNWLDSMFTTPAQYASFVANVSQNGGNVTTPFDSGYQYLMTAAHANPDFFPKLIVQPKTVADIQLTMYWASQHNMEFCVRSGGHNMLGWSTCDNGLMMSMKLMLDMEFDPLSYTAKVQAGITFGPYYEWQKNLGIHTTGGSCDTVGVVGYTQGGGYGITARKFGIAADNVNAFDVVLANGSFITASNTQYSDLFWALRGGGGGNFGVVVAVNSTMYPLLPLVTSVNATWPIAMASQVIAVWQQYYTLNGKDGLVSDDLSLYLEFSTNQPGGPGAEKIIAAIGIYWGNDPTFAAVNKMMQPLLAIPNRIQYQYALGTYQDINENMFATIEWAMAFTQGIPYFELKNSGYVSHMLADYEIDKIVEIYNCCAPVGHGSEISFESYGGAIARKPRDYIAFPHRDAYFNLFCDGFWQYDYEADVAQQWAKQFWATLSGTVLNGEVYVNYPMVTLDEHYPQAYWAENYNRLRTVKTAYDPYNFFWLPQQVVPWAPPQAQTPAVKAAAKSQYYAFLRGKFPGAGPIERKPARK